MGIRRQLGIRQQLGTGTENIAEPMVEHITESMAEQLIEFIESIIKFEQLERLE